MGEKNKIIEPDKNQIESFDNIKIYLDHEIADLKKLIIPNKELSSPDEFKLYHQQIENRLSELNEKIDNFENKIKDFFISSGEGNSLKNIISNFLFK